MIHTAAVMDVVFMCSVYVQCLVYPLPLGVDLLGVDGGVRICSCYIDVVGLNNFSDLVVDSQDGLSLLICLRKRGFKLLMSRAQAL